MPIKLFTRHPILLAQTKAGNNSYKLKMKSDKYYIFYFTIIKLEKNKVMIKMEENIIMEEKMIVKRDPKLSVLILIGQNMLVRIQIMKLNL